LRVINQHVATKPNCGKFLKTNGYQAVNESLQWLRINNSGMVKIPRMISYEEPYFQGVNKIEIDNPQPSY
jgi:hypothetical protein